MATAGWFPRTHFLRFGGVNSNTVLTTDVTVETLLVTAVIGHRVAMIKRQNLLK